MFLKKVEAMDRSVGSVAVWPVFIVLFKLIFGIIYLRQTRSGLRHRQGQESLRLFPARFYLWGFSFWF